MIEPHVPHTRKKGGLVLLSVAAAAMLTAPPAAALEPTVRIGVFGLFHPAALVVEPPAYQTLVVRAGNLSVTLEGRQRAELLVAGRVVRCVIPAGTLVAPSVQVSSRDGNDLLLAVPGRLQRRFRGKLEVTVSGDALVAVVIMDLEVAVASVVAAESLPGASLEALKAQAVVARSYYAAPQRRHPGSPFDFCDTTHCQFIREAHGPPPGSGADLADRAACAADQTRGMILLYRGMKLAALYSASCGGRTRSLAEVGLRSEAYPYYAIDCPYCRRDSRVWESRVDRDQGALLLTGSSERSRLLTARKIGWSRVPGNNYQASLEGETVVLRGRGAGHGVGLCQAGAAALASAGWDFRTILAHYYPNTTLTVDGKP